MSSVFVVISETQPVNGGYPASHNDSFWSTEFLARARLQEIAYQLDGTFLAKDETIFYTESFDVEKFDYIEYRIEEHTISQGE